ncbi:alpha beta-hydrolase [Lentinula raphanica]|uniref:Carboxypeptidase n=1 Tax=Lentinula raphanica TaxID=153919 RepID=A0AA38P787_9AGAR|nr:alpha beta-hydrolase [Lentinula raphanica]KAJ3775943.1 alpha beta-hydrolase [Lentinula raphanica]KAJ3837579.1 alpha beta-hydrolase [Lentinula raphanica]KAJ3970158.1 alpha beta-hydrolase [Lentinula raphanica]
MSSTITSRLCRTLLVLCIAFFATSQSLPNSFPHIYPGAPSGDYSPEWQSYFEVTDALPNVTFPLTRSFAGNLPVQRAGHPNDTLFFWAFEHQNGSLTSNSSNDPWGIWLNGGPGSSSMAGMFFENGPMHINGDYSMASNTEFSWDTVADYVWIDQPVGTGFSTADEDGYISGEDQMGTDFLGFLDNLVKVFPSLATRPLHITGESYAGTYIPYILKAYFESPNPPVTIVKIAIGDGSVGSGPEFQDLPAVTVIETYPQLINYDPEVFKYFEEQSHLCGYDVNLTYPQNGTIPTLKYVPSIYDSDDASSFSNRQKFSKNFRNRSFRSRLLSRFQERSEMEELRPFTKSTHFRKREERRQEWVRSKRDLTGRANGTIDTRYGCDLLDEFIDYAINFTFPWTLSQPDGGVFDVYNIPDALDPEVPIDASVFLNDNRTRSAIHAPTSKDWVLDFDFPFGSLAGNDPSPEPMTFLTELATNATGKSVGFVFFSGNDDSLIAHRGTEVVIQNTTFGGIQGFTRKPATPWTDDSGNLAGIVHQERNWTYVLFKGAGHLVAATAPEAAKVFLQQFVFGNNQTGLVTDSTVIGGEDPTLAEDVMPGSDPIFYGSMSTESSTIWPEATRAAWTSFIRTETAIATSLPISSPDAGTSTSGTQA